MLRKRIHILKFVTSVTSGAKQDSNGDWIPGTTTTTTYELPCRVEPNGSGKVLKSNDGQDIYYSWTVYLDKIPAELVSGIEVELYDRAGVKYGEGIAKLAFGYQKNAVIWV